MQPLTESTLRWSGACDDLAEELLDEAGLAVPPFDMVVLAERCRLTVAIDSAQAGRGRLKRMAGRTAILVRPEERPERLQWTIAHEIGEAFAHRVFERRGLDDETPAATREQVASELASRLLLPASHFLTDARLLDGDVLQLKRTYATASHELILTNLLRLSELSLVTVFDHGGITRRRGNGQIRPPKLLPVERDVQRFVYETGRPADRLSGDVRVQGWPVHEPGWKRELLRTTALHEFDVEVPMHDNWDVD